MGKTGEVIGLIGAGTIADSYYIPILKQLGFFKLCVSDVNEQNAIDLAKKYAIKSCDIHTLLNTASTVIITAPPHAHYDLLLQCINRGNNIIICEKPFLYSKQQAVEIINLAQKQNCTVLVAHIRRCFSAVKLAKKTIPTLPLGKLNNADIWEGSRFQYKPKSDYITHNLYGGVLLDTGSHAIDSFLYATGLTKTDMLCSVNHFRKDKDEPAHEVFYSFNINDIKLRLTLSRYQALSNKITAYYENGIVEIPLGLTPNIAVTVDKNRVIYSSKNTCFNYISQTFKKELSTILIDKNYQPFEASDFVNLSYVLETLYHA